MLERSDFSGLGVLASKRLQDEQQGEYRRYFFIRATICQGEGEIFEVFNIS